MVYFAEDVPHLPADIVAWIRKVYDALSWALDEDEPEEVPEEEAISEPDEEFERLLRTHERVLRTAAALRRREQTEPGQHAQIALLSRAATRSARLGDAGRLQRDLQVLVRFLRRVSGDGEDGEEQAYADIAIPSLAPKLGYAWHTASLPGGDASNMAVRMPLDADGKISKIRIAGRPAGKHGGKQGQHITAFLALREAPVACCYGRTPLQARENVCQLFVNLLQFPAYSDAGLNSGADASQIDLIGQLADGEWGELGLAEVIEFYIEVRDAMPGASLTREQYADTTGSGEAGAAARLRTADNAIAAGKGIHPADTLASLTKLIDLDALGRLNSKQRADQLKAFVLSLTQAFPRIMAHSAPTDGGPSETLAAQLIRSLKIVDNDAGDQIAELSALALEMCVFPYPDPGPPRPQIESFSAGIEPGLGGAGLRLDFVGRPSGSIKDGGAMGDHTTCMRLMSSAMTGCLLKDGALPSMRDLADRIDAMLKAFAPEKFLPLFGLDAMPTRADFDNHVYDERSDAPYISRLIRFHAQWTTLDEQLDAVRAGGGAAVARPQLLDLAEEVMALIDQRPTAVSYIGGYSNSKGEAVAGGELDKAIANPDSYRGEEADPHKHVQMLKHLLTLFDAKSAKISCMQVIHPSQRATYLDLICTEFVWFARNAYADIVAFIGADKLSAALHDEILAMDAETREEDQVDFDADNIRMQEDEPGLAAGRPSRKRKASNLYGGDEWEVD